MLTQLVRTVLNETASCAPDGFSADDGQYSVNAVSFWCRAPDRLGVLPRENGAGRAAGRGGERARGESERVSDSIREREKARA
jgi:hypothetical protein